MPPLLEITDLSASYKEDGQELLALQRVNPRVNAGEFVTGGLPPGFVAVNNQGCNIPSTFAGEPVAKNRRTVQTPISYFIG